MSLEKAIQHGKEKRKKYRDSRRFDWSCRNHGKCDWCKNGRLHSFKLKELTAIEELKEWQLQTE